MDSTSSPQIIDHISHSLSFTPYACRWIPCSARLAVVGCYARGSGALEVYGLDAHSAKLKLLTKSEKKEGIKCATFGASLYEARHLATGDYKGALNVYDLEKVETATFSVPQAHSSLINAIDGVGGLNIGHGAPEIATAGRDGKTLIDEQPKQERNFELQRRLTQPLRVFDCLLCAMSAGCVRVWDVRTPECVFSVEPASSSSSSSSTTRDCWAVAFGNSFNDEERVVVSGYDNGDIKFFCLRMQKLLWETNVKNGVVGLQFDRKDIAMNKLVVTTLESKFRLYDLRTLHPEEGYAYLTEKAHKSTVWCARHLPQNRDILLTTGGNGTVNLYKYEYPSQRSIKDDQGREKGVMGKLVELNNRKIAEQPIVDWDWSLEKQGLAVSTSLDQTVKVVIVTKLQSL